MNDDFYKNFVKISAEKIAKDIDDEIIRSLTGPSTNYYTSSALDSTTATYVFEILAPESQVELSVGEEHCQSCDGFGKIQVDEKWKYCEDCDGEGKLDWVEKVTGKIKKKETTNFYQTSFNFTFDGDKWSDDTYSTNYKLNYSTKILNKSNFIYSNIGA